jgi:hypothetical protein
MPFLHPDRFARSGGPPVKIRDQRQKEAEFQRLLNVPIFMHL